MKRTWHPRLRISVAAAILALSGMASPLLAQTVPAEPPVPGEFREVVDEVGRTVRIPQPVRRIVSLAPSMTETLYALGLQDRLVGDTDYCDYPPDAQTKPKVGGATNPSLEKIASLHPDLVLVTKALNLRETANSLEELGISAYATDPHSLNDIIASTKKLAALLGVPDAGMAVAEEMQRHLADLHRRLGALPPKSVLFVVWTQPLISVGRSTFLADALLHAGAVSVVDSAQSWPQVNLEEIARLQPEYLVFAESHSEAIPHEMETLATLPGWKILHAVAHRHYAVISDAVNRPAPRIISAIEDLARQLHPDAFAEKPPEAKEKLENTKPGASERTSLNFPSPLTIPWSVAGRAAGGFRCAR